MNLNIVNYDTTRHSICWTYVFLRHDVVKEPQELCLKNQEISRNSRSILEEIQCQKMIKTRKTKFENLVLKIKTR